MKRLSLSCALNEKNLTMKYVLLTIGTMLALMSLGPAKEKPAPATRSVQNSEQTQSVPNLGTVLRIGNGVSPVLDALDPQTQAIGRTACESRGLVERHYSMSMNVAGLA
jgi:hypothetical protein